MEIKVFGDVLIDKKETREDFNGDQLIEILSRPLVKPRFRVSVLNPNETVNYEIPQEDILDGGITYTEDYQSGQRRSVSLKLTNINQKYTPSINGVWLTTKFKLDVGIQVGRKILWFPKGVFVIGNVTLNDNDGEDTVDIQLRDKFAIYEGKMGILENIYEIKTGSTVIDVLNGIKNFATGSGYIYDYADVILDNSLKDFRTQSTIRIEEGGNLGQVIQELATQMSAEYYYNNVGNLCFYPINETVDDTTKPIIWTFSSELGEVWDLNLSYKNEEIVNVVKVVGDNIENGIHSAIAENNNPASPICIQQIGRRSAPKYTEANVWNDDLAGDLARYYLRKASFIGVDFSCSTNFNPLLAVNNICELENEAIKAKREKLLITSISFTSADGKMSLRLCNTEELPFI